VYEVPPTINTTDALFVIISTGFVLLITHIITRALLGYPLAFAPGGKWIGGFGYVALRGVGLDVSQHGEEGYSDGEGAILVLSSIEPTIRALVDEARTGEVGDGKICVLLVEQVVRIRTSETDMMAVTRERADA
jgi:hypothetical protein